MASMVTADHVRTLEHDLRAIFGPRLQSLVQYRPAMVTPGAPALTLAVVQTIAATDLQACASQAAGWHDRGLATPLLLAAAEFDRSLDAFPLEFGAILADYEVVYGSDPFANLRVDPADLRRACEVQVRSHLLHLREGYIETRGRAEAISALIVDSVAPLAGLLVSLARLIEQPTRQPAMAAQIVERAAHLPAGSLADVIAHAGAHAGPHAGSQPGGHLGTPIARQLFPGYLAAIEQLAEFVDRWADAAQDASLGPANPRPSADV